MKYLLQIYTPGFPLTREETSLSGQKGSCGWPMNAGMKFTSFVKSVSAVLCIVTFLCAAPIVVSGQGNTEGDISSLKSLYNATGGDNWADNSGWHPISSIAESTAPNGVTWSSEGRVTGLSLRDNDLVGYLPLDLSRLDALTELDLSSSVAGTTPNHLEGKYAMGGGRTSSIFASVLDVVTLLTALTDLNLSNTGLDGVMPALGLPAITRLDLSSNELSGEIHSSLGNLVTLTHLDLSGNLLSGAIPSELGSLTALTNLDLSNNFLSGAIPSELGSLAALTNLTLGQNFLIEAIPSELGTLTALTNLALEFNRLEGSLPLELGTLSNLTELNVAGNNLQGLPDLTALSSLTTFDVSYNYLEFDDLEPNTGITANAGQKRLGAGELVQGADGVQLSFTIGGGANNTYEWTKDGTAIASVTGISGEDTSTLTISTYSAADHDGVYVLKITNMVVVGVTLVSKPKVIGSATPIPMFGGEFGGASEIDACGRTFQDGGGSGDYDSGSNITMTLIPGAAGKQVSVAFTSFVTSSSSDEEVDFLAVSAGKFGVSTTTPVPIDFYFGSRPRTGHATLPDLGLPSVTSTSSDGALTFGFSSTYLSSGEAVAAGWEATVTCSNRHAATVALSSPVPSSTGVEVTATPGAGGRIHYAVRDSVASPLTDLTGVMLSAAAEWVVATMGSAQTIAVDELLPSTSYTMVVAPSDAGNGIIAGAGVTAIGFTTLDAVPSLTLAAPTVTVDEVTVAVTPGKAGRIHYGVLESGDTAPVNLMEVMAINPDLMASSALVGLVDVGVAQDITATGLTVGLEYVFYAILSDTFNIPLVGATVVASASFTTPTIALSNLAPLSDYVGVAVTPGLAGKIHYGVAFASAATPTDLTGVMGISGATSVDVTEVGSSQDIEVTGLTAATEYVFYAILSDASGAAIPNAVVAMASFTTLSSTVDLAVLASRLDSVTVSATPGLAGKIHYGVLESTGTAPTDLAEVMDIGNAASVYVTEIGSPQDITVTGLTAGTSYVLYAILSYVHDNFRFDMTGAVVEFRFDIPGAAVETISFTTASATVTLAAATPTVDSVTVAATPGAGGKIHYGVLASGVAAPTDLSGVMATTGAVSVYVMTPGSAQDITVTGLTAATAYVLYAILSDASDAAISSAVVAATTGFTTLDFTPTVTFGSPTATVDGVTVAATPGTEGKIHYGVLASAGTTAPTDLTGVMDIMDATSVDVTAAGSSQDITVTGLTAATGYVLYAILSDASGTAISGAVVAMVGFTTLETQVIAFGVPTPTVDGVTVEATPTEAGKIHYVALASTETALTDLAGVKAATGTGSAVAVADTAQDITVSGLTSGTDYVLYAALSDDSDAALTGDGSNVVSVEFSTLFTAIAFGTPVPTVDGVTVEATPTEAGKIHYVVLASTETALTDLAGVMGATGTGSAVAVADTAQDITVSGLTSGTDYVLYAALSDSSNAALAGDGSNVASVEFTTVVVFGTSSDGAIEVSVYPNPVKGVLSLDLPGGGLYGVSVLTLTGQLIIAEKHVGGGSSTLELSGLAKGVYLIKIQDGEGKSTTLRIIH